MAGSADGIDRVTGETYDGSVKICFKVEPPITRCLLVEREPARAATLKELEATHTNAEVYPGDVNEEIPTS